MQKLKLEDRLIVALDVQTKHEAISLAKQLKGIISTVKIGLPLFIKEGRGIIEEIQTVGMKIFLDTKLHDIPNTVYNSVVSLAHLNIHYFTVHASGCSTMLTGVMKALDYARNLSSHTSHTIPIPIGVTLLTSIDQATLQNELQVAHATDMYVLNLAKNVVDSGIQTIVCSAHEASVIKKNIKEKILIMTPGIRPHLDLHNDQARILTPEAAINNGSDILIVGRPVIESKDPAGSVHSILDSIKKLTYTTTIALATLLLSHPLHTFAADNSYLYFEKGKNFYAQLDYDHAQNMFEQATAQQPYNTLYRYYLATAFFYTKQYHQAKKEFEKIIALKPGSEEADLSKKSLVYIYDILHHKKKLSVNISSPLVSGQQEKKQANTAILQDIKAYGDNYIDKVTDKGNVIHWNLSKMPLRIYIETENNKLQHFDKNFPKAVTDGINVWINAFQDKVKYVFVKDKHGADIRFMWRDLLDSKTIEVNKETAYTAGVTSPEYTGQQLYSMSIIISLVDPTGKPHNYKQIKSIVAHEFGHALGIVGHSPEETDLMYPTTHDIAKLSQRDVNTLKLLYDLAADVSNFDKNTYPSAKTPGQTDENATFKNTILGVKEERLLKEIKDLQNNLKQTPDNFVTHINIGSLYTEINDLKQAEYHFKKAVTLNSKNEIAHSNLGNIYNAMGKKWEAYKEYKTSIKIDPSKPKPYFELAKIAFELNQLAEAQDNLEKYRSLSPKAKDDPAVTELMNKLSQTDKQEKKQ